MPRKALAMIAARSVSRGRCKPPAAPRRQPRSSAADCVDPAGAGGSRTPIAAALWRFATGPANHSRRPARLPTRSTATCSRKRCGAQGKRSRPQSQTTLQPPSSQGSTAKPSTPEIPPQPLPLPASATVQSSRTPSALRVHRRRVRRCATRPSAPMRKRVKRISSRTGTNESIQPSKCPGRHSAKNVGSLRASHISSLVPLTCADAQITGAPAPPWLGHRIRSKMMAAAAHGPARCSDRPDVRSKAAMTASSVRAAAALPDGGGPTATLAASTCPVIRRPPRISRSL
mmetsp:Transcript_125790/g.355687  ORF Transcript_125790/g.355687 Transcript_125790/m.355687 type:complete len:287 (+) Transcript_125790:187-1047(+)